MYWYADPGLFRRNNLTFLNGARQVGPGLLDGQLFVERYGLPKKVPRSIFITFDPLESSGKIDFPAFSEGFRSS